MKIGLIRMVALACVVACTSVARADEGDELKFGFTPVFGQAEMKANFEPLMKYLSDSIGRKVVLYIAKDYGDLRTQMESGQVDIGNFSPFAYVDAQRGGKIRIIAQSVMDHTPSYRGLIIARKDSGLKSVDDLKGRRFAFVDPKSASGYVYPRAMLVEKGIDPDSYFKETIFAGGHDKVIASVLDGSVEAGAIWDGALGAAKAKGIAINSLVTLSNTDPIPHDAVAVRSEMYGSLFRRIQVALFELDKTEAGRKVIAQSTQKLNGYVLVDDGRFDVVRRTAKIAGM